MAKLHEETQELLKGFVEKYNNAISEKDMESKDQADKDIKSGLKEYQKQKFDSVLANLKAKENPLLEAVTQLTYPILKTKSNRTDGIETSIELVEADARIDLVRVCEYCGLSTEWKYKVEKLGLLLSMRNAKKIGGTAAELAQIAKDYRMNDLARREEMGETPDSDTQVTKLIQDIMDVLFPNLPKIMVDGKEKARKANSHDAAFMIALSTGEGKAPCTVKLVDPKVVHRLFAQVAHRIITNGRYKVTYKKVKNAEEKKVETIVVEDTKVA